MAEIKLRAYTNFANDYRIIASHDGNVWPNRYTLTNNDRELLAIEFPTDEALPAFDSIKQIFDDIIKNETGE